ncbi:hypothetical protein GCM10011309_11920 [Litorimonas cladophorae]|uniref:Uncharacterized protein n=1 Tax=Litorimonas cladophorae TaxID=1220491 RepID=A0A918KJP8_9PROT|nr:hypothetical protein GCM10011309_11920 [Litorimonas cladophorae]
MQKTRTGAAKLVSDGKVRLTRNGVTERTKKPHTLVRPGDGVTFMRGKELYTVRMKHAGTRRGPAPEAQTLYERLGDSAGKT